jgi:phosphohistidine phosphatase SixA
LRTQRQLKVRGVRQVVRTRNALQTITISVGEMLSLPFCRALQAADLGFGRQVKVDGLKLPPSKDCTAADTAAMRAARLRLLANASVADTNTVIMAHDASMPAGGGPDIRS